jgi:hypothetical protein
MPPWKPTHGYGDFEDERHLSDAEISTLARWADSGAKEGDPRDLPPAPTFPDGWQLGKPDLVLKMPKPITIPAAGKDVHRVIVLPTGLPKDRTVAAIEFRPGNRRVVHHATFAFGTPEEAGKKDEAKPGPGRRRAGGSMDVKIAGFLGGYAPGATPRRFPDGVGRLLKKDAHILARLHYVPTGKEEKDQSSLGIYFTDKPAKQMLRVILLRDKRLRIPAGEKRHRVANSYTLPVDVHAIGVLAHMHLLGREMKVTATLPDGKKQPLLWISDWDFNWQGQYQYVKPLALPKGTLLEMEAFFDNSPNNPKNPNKPPKTVWFGPRTVDEMCGLRVQIVVDHPERDGHTFMKDISGVYRERKREFQEWKSKHGR